MIGVSRETKAIRTERLSRRYRARFGPLIGGQVRGAHWVPKPRESRGESREMTERLSRQRTRVFAGNLRTERGKHALLAMQKVEGSNPFSRFREGLHLQGFFV
jgi:hypothetical protein